MPEPVNLLTVGEVSAALRVSPATIYRLIHAGKLPAVRVGRSLRVPTEAVRKLLDTTTKDNGS